VRVAKFFHRASFWMLEFPARNATGYCCALPRKRGNSMNLCQCYWHPLPAYDSVPHVACRLRGIATYARAVLCGNDAPSGRTCYMGASTALAKSRLKQGNQPLCPFSSSICRSKYRFFLAWMKSRQSLEVTDATLGSISPLFSIRSTLE
jgi:hypothetical protein